MGSHRMPRHISALSPVIRYSHLPRRSILSSWREYSDSSSKGTNTNPASSNSQNPHIKPSEEPKPSRKTQAELDAELMEKLQGLDSEGGAAGVEYEDGKPASMKRSVRNNMFSYNFRPQYSISGLPSIEKKGIFDLNKKTY